METLLQILALAITIPIGLYIMWLILIAVEIPFLRIK